MTIFQITFFDSRFRRTVGPMTTVVQMTGTENVLIEAVNFRSRRTRLSLLTIFLKAGLLALV